MSGLQEGASSQEPVDGNVPEYMKVVLGTMPSNKEAEDPSAESLEQNETIKPELGIEFNKEPLDSLSKEYPELQEMFEGFASMPPIEFKRGEVNFVFGKNGAGKSTLTNAIYLAAKISQDTERILKRPGIETIEEARERALD